jgi:hypothetical protein
MKAEPETTYEDADTRDISLPGGCILCGGDLDVRLAEGTAASVCMKCHWISRPHMKREDGAVHVIHPAGLFA